MKKYKALFGLAIVCLSFSFGNAQSRRVAPYSESSDKTNKRDPKPAETPAPTPEETQPVNNNPSTADDKDVIKIDTDLVTIPVKVSDRGGKFVAGLTKADFRIIEDQTEQEIAYFTNEEQPFTVALVLDMSYSSTFKITEIQNAAMAFVAQLRPNDKVIIVSFDQEVHVLCNPTSDRKVLQLAVKSTKIESGTSLYDAVDLVINRVFKEISGRKAIVLFTDGVDTTSYRAFAQNNLSDALELDALVYPIEYDTYGDVQSIKNKSVIIPPPTANPFPVPTTSTRNPLPFPVPAPTAPAGTPTSQGTSQEDYRKAEEYLTDLANRTGGRLYKASTTANLAVAFSRIASELREFYSLGYYPKEESKPGSKRGIKIRVNRQGLVVRARDFYIVGKKSGK
ncbi:MAG: VWA domain-containing protein [Pyrinomonadaceae bacterium]